MKKMYIVNGVNTCYFYYTDWDAEKLRGIIRDGETVTECAAAYAFGVRYGCQPIYEPYTYTDAHGIERTAEMTHDRRELRAQLGITDGRNFW